MLVRGLCHHFYHSLPGYYGTLNQWDIVMPVAGLNSDHCNKDACEYNQR